MSIQTPDWVKHAVFYQIFPDRFARSGHHSLLSQPQWEAWDASPTQQGYKGGDLWGVIKRLDYLQNLGITAIYFTPIFQSTCNHRYHTHDYYQVDPILGGNAALRALLDECHQRGMKVVLDGVFNHASRGFFFFNDILENGPHSPWVDWFRIENWPLAPYVGDQPANYLGWWNNRALPVFNHNNPDVRRYIMQVAEHWLKFGIDGWRLDVPFEVKVPGFWQEFRDRVKAINPDAYIVGEVWRDSSEWLDGTQFDGVMNYLFTAPTIAFTAGDRVNVELVRDQSYDPYPALSAVGYAEKISHLLALYPWEIQLTQLNLLDSHDTARLVTIAQGDKATVELATLLMMTFPGAPSIYYGDEIGLPGGRDPDCRRGFPPESEWDYDLLEYHRQLIALRQAHPCLRTGEYQVLLAEGEVYIFSRSLATDIGTDTVIVAVNVGTQATTIDLVLPDLQRWPTTVQLGPAKLGITVDQLELYLPARSGCLIGSPA